MTSESTSPARLHPHGGVERDPLPCTTVQDGLRLPGGPWRLIQIEFHDRTDLRDDVVREHELLLHPTSPLHLAGNLFVIEHTLEQTGFVLLQQTPLPDSRPAPPPWDLEIVSDGATGFVLRGYQDPDLTTWQHLSYHGGRLGRTRVLQTWQRSRRPQTSGHRIPSALSNTWGDRSRDSRMNAEFMLQEIACASEMGIQVVQLDDGWQKGMTSNSAGALKGGGCWEGFWNADPEFWTPHPDRFPDGLTPLLRKAKSCGVELGLWFAPDSWQEFTHWERDADCLLSLYEETGIRFFKLDSINATSDLAFTLFQQLTDRVRKKSGGEIVMDLDITGDHPRPGYWGAVDVGPIFLENRYTDWRNYWPHHTLRNLWRLGSWVDPLRLRMEWLNPHRNPEQYGTHPLAPAAWPLTTLCGITLAANPLCWCELQRLPEKDRASLKSLFTLWSEQREAWASGTILPLGECPDGYGISAFASIHPEGDRMHVMMVRGLGPESARITLPPELRGSWRQTCLYGDGTAESVEEGLRIRVDQPLGFCWLRLERIHEVL